VTSWIRSRDARYTALVAILAILSMVPALLQPSRLVYPSWSDYSDLTLIHWPKALVIRESLAQGHGWPLWSPYALSGQPLAANQLAMLFYPPALGLLIGPLAWVFSLFYALHVAWAAVGTYWLVRGLGRQPESALLAGVIFALAGKLAAHTASGHVSLVAAISWTPWAFSFLHRALVRRSTLFSILTGVALAAQAATHTYALVYTAYGLLIYTAMFLFLVPPPSSGRMRNALRYLPRLALVPLTAILLGAAQILPLMEMAPYSNRAFSFEEATLFSLSPIQTLTGLLFPTPNVGHEWIIYPGLLTLALAAAAWRARRQWPVVAFGALSIVGVLLALGSYTPLYRLFYEFLPGLRWMRTPARIWFFVTLGLAVLSAYGLEEWQSVWRQPRSRIIRLLLVAAMAFGLALSLSVMLALGQRGRGAWGLGVFGLLAGALLLWASPRRAWPRFVWLAVALLVADLLTFQFTVLRLVPQEEVMVQGREPADWLASQSGMFRVYSPSYSLPQPAASEAGLQQVDGVEPVHLKTYDRFMALAGGYEEATFSVTIPPFPEDAPIDQAHRDSIPDLRMLGLLNARYLATAFPLKVPGLNLMWQETNSWIYANERALPRAFVVHQAEAVTHEEAWDRVDTVDLAHVALVEGGQPLTGPYESTPARLSEQTPNRLVVKTDLDTPGLLVLSEIWYPGWRARDNGAKTAILRTDVLLRGVYLDAGSHTVELDYQPWTIQIGLAISSSVALVLLALGAYQAWRRS
jgi:hypothetical protein